MRDRVDPRQRASAQELLSHDWLAGVQGPKASHSGWGPSPVAAAVTVPVPVPAALGATPVEPAAEAVPAPPPVPVAMTPAKKGNLCFRCNEKLSFKSKGALLPGFAHCAEAVGRVCRVRQSRVQKVFARQESGHHSGR